jgi:hypothetical protein
MRRLLTVVLAVLALGACASTTDERASGVTERWLQAISETGRERVRDDATDRAAEDGDVALATSLLAPDHDDDEAWFADLEVGRSVEHGDEARVPVRVTLADDDRKLYRTAVLHRRGSSWEIVDVDESRGGEDVPSEGGARPATAQGRHWLAGIAVGAVVTVASALVIELQPAPEPTRRAGAASH